MSLIQLLSKSSTSSLAIADFLDAAAPDVRQAELLSLNRSQQRALYERVADAPAMTMEDLIPATIAPLAAVVHEGQNSLPLFRRFQKVCCKPSDGSERVFGFNEGATRSIIGPGYFVAVPTPAADRSRGAVVVDYAQIPDGPVSAGWPQVVDNSVGLQRFVFRGTSDYLRRVSTHASIGAAWKNGKAFNSWFVLCRS